MTEAAEAQGALEWIEDHRYIQVGGVWRPFSLSEEFPAGFVIRDELNRMDRENAEWALRRLGHSEHKWQFDLSHPTYPGIGIDQLFENSSRGEWYVHCEECGTWQQLDFFANVDRASHTLTCAYCDKGIWTKRYCIEHGQWRHADPDNPIKGFHVTQLLSPRRSIEEICKEWEDAQGDVLLDSFDAVRDSPPGSVPTSAASFPTARDCAY